jgi:CheY-like chemotaxis protein/nitrogen-specific signal transduction histidine kinase
MPEDTRTIRPLEPEEAGLRAQLAEAREQLRQARRGQAHFMTALGHELRNPLMPIRNSVALLRRAGTGDPIIQRAGEIIERQVAHMTRLVDDLLDVSRIQAGRITLDKEELDLDRLARSVVAEYQPLLEAKGLRLDYAPPSRPLQAFADPQRVAQIIGHLLDNANQFTDPGGKVEVGLRPEPDGFAVLTVRDQGAGMDAGILERLFEPFIQDEADLDRIQGGLGLGLALVKGLAALHGGTVAAWSDGPGRGAEFTVRLPVLRTAHPAQSRAAAAQAAGSARPRRILIVEDLLDAAITMELLLEMLGHQVEVAADGKTALGKAHRFEPEIILCDIGLPGQLDGYEVARAIRGNSRLKGAYLIALTGFGAPEDKAKARLAGFDLHLTKPLDPASLEPLIASLP